MPDDNETLRRFILRARRVNAHSIVQTWDELVDHAEGKFVGHLDLTGRVAITRQLPKNEEVFESLASRLRPLTVKSEPVYYVKVFDAIERIMGNTNVGEAIIDRCQELRRAWDDCEIQGVQVQTYSAQQARVDGTGPTTEVSDTQLAAAWLYADLVHADAKGPKKKALVFPLRERYAAAVRIFSYIAILTVETLRLVESLRDAQLLKLDDSAWDDEVTVGKHELSQEGKLYVAPVGSVAPGIRESLASSVDWTQLTVTELFRINQENQIRVVLRGQADESWTSYDAAITRRINETSHVELDILIAGSVMFKFRIDFEGEWITGGCLLGWNIFDKTNELKLASTQFFLEYYLSATVAFEVGGNELFSLDPSSISEEEHLELEVIAETLRDIVMVERHMGQTFELCDGQFDDRHRVALRRVRLLLEGHIIHGTRYPVTAIAPEGHPPDILRSSAKKLNIGGAIVPIPEFVTCHPAMISEELDHLVDVGLRAKSFRITPPPGERFFEWYPDAVEVVSSEGLEITASWGLIGVDEESFNG